MPLVHLDASGKISFKRLLSYVVKFKSWFPLIFLCLILLVIADSILIQATEPLIDKVFDQKDPRWIKYIPWVFLVAFLLRGISTAGSTYLIGKLARNVIFDLRSELFQKYTLLPTRYFDNTNDAELTARMTFHIEQIANASSRSLKVLIQDSLTVFAMLGVMLYNSRELFLFVFLIIPLLVLVIRRVSYLFKRYSERMLGTVSQINKITEETVIGHKVIKTYQGAQTEAEKFRLANNENRKNNIKIFLTNAGSSLVVQLIAGFAIAAVLYFAIHHTNISSGKFMAFFGALMYMNTPLKRLLKVNETIQLGVASAETIFAVLDNEAELDTGDQLVGDNSIQLEFREVDFSYTNAEDKVLSKISFSASNGKMIALVGSSGSGKSTVASLIPRFYDVSHGSVVLNGIDIRDYQLNEYRQLISFVSQDVFLFNDTIANNIAYPLQASECMESVQAAAKAAHVLEFTDGLKHGLDTVVGDRGVLLSGGQRQRIAIARAIMKNAPILILDEATSALDTESERLVQDALNHLMQDRTSIVIAHRLSTVEMADEILVFDHGNIIERGSHQELIQMRGQYYKLQQLQSGQQV